jgi:RimJ/RimL family protein N-acetyltransferase
VTVLTTQRLILREMSSADLDDIAALLGDEDVMRYYPRPKTRSEAQGWIDWNQALYQLGLRRLIAIINPANLPSQGVARKIGLEPERVTTVHGRECVIYAGPC